MRVIFADIDGVVNTLQIYKEIPAHLKDADLRQADGYFFDLCDRSDKRVSNTQATLWLDKICRDNDAKIVISSTWRLGDDKDCTETKECLYNSGLGRDIEIIGKTPSSSSFHRGTEIKAYLEKHPEITNFVILDDDSDMEPYMDRLVHTDVHSGITAKTRIEVSCKFNNEPEPEFFG